MAPPTPVLVKEDLSRVYELDKRLGDAQCTLKSLTQFECTFNGGLVNCYPFKRLFKDCLLANGKRQRVEVTEPSTNAAEKLKSSEAKRFLNAESKIRQMYEKDLTGSEE
ncbi:unnamed protein product [Wickerhamomyces anomalus]